MTVEEAVEQATADARNPKVCVVGSFIQYRALELLRPRSFDGLQDLVKYELYRRCIPLEAT